ncbi:hypothetical protein [Microbacterium galbinum]|nr:hypothetical protein [Microbacterium galbinum]MCK2031254.1 hypothetical protein [Microbacterium galbinum]
MDAAASGIVVSVSVTMPDRLDYHTVWVNPAQLGWWAIVDFPDPDAS